ncbi:MAG: hypothetical protein JRI68_25080 [Deltaproteobacteria bacterium]|nr:hypothetical protein [Deltaproteobacteria bacterium]
MPKKRIERWIGAIGALGACWAAASPAGAAECDDVANHPEWVFCHDFEVSDAGDFGTYWNDIYGEGDRMFLLDDNPVGVVGVRSMRLQIVNDTGQALSSGVTSGPKKFLGATVDWDTLHYRRYLRFNDDFHQGNFMHLGGMSACHANLYPWGCMGGAGVKPQGDERFSSNLEPWSDYQNLPWPGRWGFYSYYHQMYMDCGFPGPNDCYGDMFSPTTDSLASRGDWHAFEMAIDPGTPGQADGSQTFWVDGEHIYTATGIAWRTTAELRPNQVGVYLYIHNNPANTTNILDVDNVLISRQYIGPASCEDGVEIQAACLCGGVADPNDGSNAHTNGYCCAGSWQPAPCGIQGDAGVGGSGTGGGGTGGSTPDGGTAGSGASPSSSSGNGAADDGGCGCRFPAPTKEGPTPLWWTVSLLSLVGLRRRKQRGIRANPEG